MRSSGPLTNPQAHIRTSLGLGVGVEVVIQCGHLATALAFLAAVNIVWAKSAFLFSNGIVRVRQYSYHELGVEKRVIRKLGCTT